MFNRKRIIRLTIVISLLAALGIMAIPKCIIYVYMLQTKNDLIKYAAACIGMYIVENGALPQDFADLTSKGYIIKTDHYLELKIPAANFEIDDLSDIELYTKNDRIYYKTILTEFIPVGYSLDLKKLALKDEALINPITRKEILLIGAETIRVDGVNYKEFNYSKGILQKINIQLYNLLMKVRE